MQNRWNTDLLETNQTLQTMFNNNILDVWQHMFWLLDCIRQISSRSRIARPHPEKSLRGEVWCRKVKIALTGSLAFCANTAKVDSLLHRHLVWETAGDGSVWQLSASQFSSPASLLIGYSDNTHKHTHRKKENELIGSFHEREQERP